MNFKFLVRPKFNKKAKRIWDIATILQMKVSSLTYMGRGNWVIKTFIENRLPNGITIDCKWSI